MIRIGLLILAFLCGNFYLAGAQTGPGRIVPGLGNLHIESPATPHPPYNSSPPTSGPHVPYIAKWGVHKTPIPNEIQVHNLEDGGVMIQYHCTNCDDLIATLENFAAEFSHVIVAPYPDMRSRIAVTAWARIDTFDEFDEARVRRFIEAYIGIDHHVRK